MGITKLTWDEVREMRKRYAEDENVTLRELAKEYGVCISTIHNVISYVFWKHDPKEIDA